MSALHNLATIAACSLTAPRLRGEVDARNASGEGDSPRAEIVENSPHPDPLPGNRAFTPVFDGLCGEREREAAL